MPFKYIIWRIKVLLQLNCLCVFRGKYKTWHRIARYERGMETKVVSSFHLCIEDETFMGLFPCFRLCELFLTLYWTCKQFILLKMINITSMLCYAKESKSLHLQKKKNIRGKRNATLKYVGDDLTTAKICVNVGFIKIAYCLGATSLIVWNWRWK